MAEWTAPQIVEYCAVAGIIDAFGGLRIVVTEPWRMHHHVGQGEYLFVCPGFLVTEPIAFAHYPRIVKRVEAHIAHWFRERNDPDLDMPLRQYQIRCIQSRPLGSLDTSKVVWG